MDLVAVMLGAALAVLVVVLVVRSNQRAYGAHMQQLQPARTQRELTIGSWTRADVAQHASEDDVWIIVRDQRDGKHKVYDVTDYVHDHPGGMAILNHAGGDSTEVTLGFHGPQHPATAFEMLASYYIGPLVDP